MGQTDRRTDGQMDGSQHRVLLPTGPTPSVAAT